MTWKLSKLTATGSMTDGAISDGRDGAAFSAFAAALDVFFHAANLLATVSACLANRRAGYAIRQGIIVVAAPESNVSEAQLSISLMWDFSSRDPLLERHVAVNKSLIVV